ncbi:TlpA family protein disulfide reductase [Rubrivirga litoralis]|uniref:Thioredoxin family protein n=1 Tax=Rubrivirga litoralis TaxID=3075598 RepID=A0ABU3BU01_9BACT|nr:thioredoxin family protein [Rubrivirga sp. F394]MDT0632769.1 thioredoxin family protein [Rubrivirga sp. F394]
MTRFLSLALVAGLAAGAAAAQVPPGHATTSPIRPEDYPERITADDLTTPPADRTVTEEVVQRTIERDGVHVVHFWAPWCGNSQTEFETGWYEVIEEHPDVTFTFVTIWNDGRDGADELRRYGIPDSATILAQPDRGPSANPDARRRTFLGLPLSWTPSTWIFNRGGQLATAFNYGEVSADMLEDAIEHAQADWTHD